jgi:Cupin domain
MTTTSNVGGILARPKWTAADPPPISYLVVPHDTREWRPSWSDGLIETDLGFGEASHGVFDAWCVRAESDAGAGEGWAHVGDDIFWMIVTDGQIELQGDPGVHLVLNRHDAVYMPKGWRPTKYWYSEFFSCIAMRGNFSGDSPADAESDSSSPAAPIVSIEGPHSWMPFEEERIAYLEYRDFGFTELTGGRMSLNATRASGPAPADGTGRHSHTWAQWNVTLSGWYDITVGGHDRRRLPAGDSTYTPADAIHHVHAFSRDNSILNFTTPARS